MEMNKCENIFEQVQKQTPYRTPEGFFDTEEQELKRAIRRRASKRLWLRYAAAAAILLFAAVYPLMHLMHSSHANEVPLYVQTDNTQGEWTDFAEADIFLENMDW